MGNLTGSEILIALSLITLGAVIGIGVWQLVSVRRSQGRRGETGDTGIPGDPPET